MSDGDGFSINSAGFIFQNDFRRLSFSDYFPAAFFF